jgi:hypothetical protein
MKLLVDDRDVVEYRLRAVNGQTGCESFDAAGSGEKTPGKLVRHDARALPARDGPTRVGGTGQRPGQAEISNVPAWTVLILSSRASSQRLKK